MRRVPGVSMTSMSALVLSDAADSGVIVSMTSVWPEVIAMTRAPSSSW